jgi:hypothetical protein
LLFKQHSDHSKIKLLEDSLKNVEDFKGEIKGAELRCKKETNSTINMIETLQHSMRSLKEEQDSIMLMVNSLKGNFISLIT